MSVQDYAPAGPGLLIKLVHFKPDAGRLGKSASNPWGQGAEVDGPLVHGVRDRQDLREIGRLPPQVVYDGWPRRTGEPFCPADTFVIA